MTPSSRRNVPYRGLVMGLWAFGAVLALSLTAATVSAVPDFSGDRVEIDVAPDPWCDTLTIDATGDIARVVVRIDGVDETTVLGSGISRWEVVLDGVTDVWVQTDRQSDDAGRRFRIGECSFGPSRG